MTNVLDWDPLDRSAASTRLAIYLGRQGISTDRVMKTSTSLVDPYSIEVELKATALIPEPPLIARALKRAHAVMDDPVSAACAARISPALYEVCRDLLQHEFNKTEHTLTIKRTDLGLE